MTLILIAATSAMMYAVMGGSKAMQTALVEDLLSLLAPASFLVAARFQRRPVDQEYINGHTRAFDITFFVAAVALAGVGLAVVIDALHTLLTASHPVITTVALGDRVIWQGWLMIGGLLISVVPPVVLGRLKLKIAPKIALKTLHADADTNKADWMTALAGVLGIAGIGYGWWWADSTAALFIACSILKDGASNLRSAVRDMHDAYPQVVDGGSDDPLVEAIYRAVLAMEFVSQCQVRFHEEGNRLSGVVFVTTVDERLTSEQVASVVSTCRHVSWRIDQVTVTLSGPRETPDLGA
jgi:divalent metal cation (Fe/Co/Zn/Cd) transporter